MSLFERVENAYIALAGNRVTLASSTAAGISSYGFFSDLSHYFSGEEPLQLRTLGFLVSGLASSIFIFSTKCGLGTAAFYRAADRHIKRRGTLKENVVRKWIQNAVEDDSTLGYCQLQGIYLAAKKHGIEDIFFELKEKYSSNTMRNW